jgi:hypothetical protein
MVERINTIIQNKKIKTKSPLALISLQEETAESYKDSFGFPIITNKQDRELFY